MLHRHLVRSVLRGFQWLPLRVTGHNRNGFSRGLWFQSRPKRARLFRHGNRVSHCTAHFSPFSDRYVAKMNTKHGVRESEHRLLPLLVGGVMVPFASFGTAGR